MQFYSNAGITTGTFEEIERELLDQKFWIRFFVRPCCPSCDEENADRHLNDFSSQIESCEELEQEQRDSLLKIVRERGDWYKSLPVCRH